MATAWDVEWVEECGSTMEVVRDRARAGSPAGLVVVADHQTAGRGRLGRRWEAPAGASLLCSVLLRPEVPSHLDTLAVGLAALDAVDRLSPTATATLKWPNDLLVDLPGVGERKLAGVLAEAEQDGGGWAVVVGIGLNVAWPPREDLPPELAEVAGALSHAGPAPTRQEVLGAMLDALEARLAAGPNALLEAARARCSTLGRAVRVELPGGAVEEGVAEAIDDDGRLVVARTGAEALVVAAGDVVHVRPRR